MNRLPIVILSMLLVGCMLGCESEETPIAQGRSMGAPPVPATDANPNNETNPAATRAAAADAIRSADRGNQVPVLVGILIEPFGEVTVRNDITAKPQAKDMDGDTIELDYTWRVNGSVSFVDEPVLPKSEFRRGDWIELTVVASDGRASSEPLVSKPFEVTNAAPAITSTPGGLDERGTLEYQVQIEDPDDDDGFSYQLLDGPEGMQIDAGSGLLTWRPSKRQAGTHAAQLEVTDPNGGKTRQRFELAMDLVSGAPPASLDAN